MNTTWKTVRVFISSTFRDMQAERDWLVKRVFPALRQRLEPHRIHLVDIDLRWGITREQADNDQVLGLCLQQIDECRPFFLGLLGGRYGWVPANFPVEVGKRYGWTQAHTGKSVTELEIIHGVLNDPTMHGRALFCFRSDRFLDAIADQQRRVFVEGPTDEELRDLGRVEAERQAGKRSDQLKELKERIKKLSPPMPLFDGYPCQWNTKLLDPVSKTPGRPDGLKEFGDWIIETLEQAILHAPELQEHLATVRTEAQNELDEERGFHEQFIENRTRVYVGRQQLQDELKTFVMGAETKPCLLTGPSGSGKSAALAKFASVWRTRHPDEVLIAHFVGASSRSTSLREMLRHLCAELKDTLKLEDEIKQDVRELSDQFREFLAKVPVDRRVLLVLDALNQLDETDNAHSLFWLPTQIPSQVRLMVSCIDDPDRPDQLALVAMRRRAPHEIMVGLLTDEERLGIVREIPSVAAKTLDADQIELLLKNPATKNPLFLLVALEELRGFGSFEELNRKIAGLPQTGDTLTAIFQQVIRRLGEDFNTDTVKDVLSLLACSRYGLSERELQELLSPNQKSEIGDQQSDDLFPILRQLRPYLQSRGPLLDFYHRHPAKATHEEFFKTGEAMQHDTHHRLAAYFRIQSDPAEDCSFSGDGRPLAELPYHLVRCGLHDTAADILSDLRYLDARCSAHLFATLLDDYDLLGALKTEPLKSLQSFLVLNMQRLICFPKAFFSLVMHEGPPAAQAAAQQLLAKGLWRKHWLQTQPVLLPSGSKPTGKHPSIKITRRFLFNRSCAVTLARKSEIVFRLKRIGEVALTDLKRLVDLPYSVTGRNIRPLALFASDDASRLAIAYENGEADIIQLHWSAEKELVSQTLTDRVHYFLPETETPVMAWRDHELWYQPDAKCLVALSCGAAELSSRRHEIPSAAHGELAGIAFQNQAIVISLRIGAASALAWFDASDAAVVVGRQQEQARQICACDQNHLAVAWSDQRLIFYDTSDGLTALNETRLNNAVVQMHWQSDRLFWATAADELHAWRPDDGSPNRTRLLGDEGIYPGGRHAQIGQFATLADNSLAAVTDLGVTCFHLACGDDIAPPIIYGAFEDPEGRVLAVQKRDDGAWLVDVYRKLEIQVATDRDIRMNPACDTNGKCFLLSLHGPASTWVNLGAQQVNSTLRLPLAISSVAGDPQGGFWLAERMGGIYRVEVTGHCKQATNVNLRGVSGTALLCANRLLIWAGTCYAHQESGEDMAYAMRFYRISSTGLELWGERIFKKNEGHVEAFDYNAALQQLVIAVRKTSGSPCAFLIGCIDQFIQSTETVKPHAAFSCVVHRMRLSIDGRHIHILGVDGTLMVLDHERMEIDAILPPTNPFTDMARGGNIDSSALIVASETKLYAYKLETTL